MFEKTVHLARKGGFMLRLDDIGDECIYPYIGKISMHITSEIVNRLSIKKHCLSWIRWVQLIKKDHQNDLSDQM